MMAGDMRLAINLYNQQGEKSVNDNLLNMADAYAFLNQPDSALYYIKKQKELWGLPPMILYYAKYVSLHKTDEWRKIANDLENDYFKKNPYANKQLTRKIWEMGIDDQFYRAFYGSYEKKYGVGSKGLDSIYKLQHNLDSLNVIKLEKLVKKNAWPKSSEVGGSATASIPFLIIQHTENITVQKKYLPIIEEMVKQKEADPASFAYLTDRIQVKENKKQLYGTQVIKNEKTGQPELCPIEDEINVDKRRAEVGLEPLKDYLQMFGIEYGN